MTTVIKVFKTANNLFRNRILLFSEIAEAYQPAITRNKNKLKEMIKEKAELAVQSELARRMRVAKGFYTLEMAPPNMNEIQKIKADLALIQEFVKTGCFKFLTVKQALLLILVGTEVALWFFLGETIGKMHFVGYKV